jgi:hypothetical protein
MLRKIAVGKNYNLRAFEKNDKMRGDCLRLAVQRGGHTFKIQAADFRNVLAGLASMFVVLQQCIRPFILGLKALYAAAHSPIRERAALDERSVLLPNGQ